MRKNNKASKDAKRSRLLSIAESMAPKRKTWLQSIPPDLADEINEAVRLIASGESSVDCAALSRAVVADLTERKRAKKFNGQIPSDCSVWQSLRRMVLELSGGRK